MGHHAALFAKSHNLNYVPIERASEFEEIYQLGVYSEREYRNVIDRTSGRAVLHWCGKDAFMYEDRMKRNKWGGYRPWPSCVEHVAQSDRQIQVLEQFGISARKVLRFNDKRENYPLTDLPEKFSVLVFAPIDRDDDLYFDQILEVIKFSPDISFTLLGFSRRACVLRALAYRDYHKIFNKRQNTKIIFPVSLLDQPQAYREILKNHSCLLRLKKTEGFSQMVMQMLLLGRSVLSNIEQEHVRTVDPQNVQSLVAALSELSQEKQASKEASNYYHARSDINNFDFLS